MDRKNADDITNSLDIALIDLKLMTKCLKQFNKQVDLIYEKENCLIMEELNTTKRLSNCKFIMN